MDANIIEAYSLLIDHYEQGDQLYLFGFSRGAYTARSLAGFIRNSGLLKREFRDRLQDAFALYRDRSKKSAPDEAAAMSFKQKYAYSPPIEFIGVWDTVGALGVPVSRLGLFSWFGRMMDHRYRFHDTSLSSIVRHAYHAVSIHEHRGTFPVTLWEKQAHSTEQVLEQVWFPGVHCDVGGGYFTTGLSDAAFDWMIEKAKGCGLLFREAALAPGIGLAADPLGKLHDSYGLAFKLIDWFNFQFGGAPRAFDANPAYCEAVSNVARDRYQLKSDETWPPTFVDELRRPGTAETAKVHDIHP